MRHVLRRILWIGPISFLLSVAVFWLLTAAAGFSANATLDRAAEQPGFARGALPRFFNSDPQSVRELTLRAVRSVAADDEDAPAARVELARLGGAALPHVLPTLDELEPKGRSRVALALAPVARRMKVGTEEELESPEAATVFWTRFWADRAIDFRPVVVKRAVDRLAQKSTKGRRDDVRQLDTYALADLISAMKPLESGEDVKRARRVATVAAEIAGQPWRIPAGASLHDAESTVMHWQAWWLEHRSEYVTLSGSERTLAMLGETQYGRWVAHSAANRLGFTTTGQTVLDLASSRAPVTLALLACGLLGGWLLGIALGVMGAARAHRLPDSALAIPSVAVAALPVAVFAVWAIPESSFGRRALAGVLMMAVAAAIVSRHQRSATRVALDQEYSRTARAFGASPWRLALWSVRASSVAALSLAGVSLPVLVTTSFVVEHALGLRGLGASTLFAVTTRDVPWLMASALGLSALTAFVQIASDALLEVLDPRVGVALARKRGALL